MVKTTKDFLAKEIGTFLRLKGTRHKKHWDIDWLLGAAAVEVLERLEMLGHIKIIRKIKPRKKILFGVSGKPAWMEFDEL